MNKIGKKYLLCYPSRDMEEYVHRVGRTGRAGKTGTSITLWDKADWKHAADLIEILEEAGQEVPDFLRREASRYNVDIDD